MFVVLADALILPFQLAFKTLSSASQITESWFLQGIWAKGLKDCEGANSGIKAGAIEDK